MKTKQASEDWIKVGMDSGGIAAGADRLMDFLRQSCDERRLSTKLSRSGSYGYAYLDPLIEVCRAGEMPCLYGMADDSLVRSILDHHIAQDVWLNDHIIASRDRATDFSGPTRKILVCDTSAEKGNRTVEFQSLLHEALKSEGLSDQVQVVRALDVGIYQEGVVVQFLPSKVTYSNVLARDVEGIVKESVQGGTVMKDLLWDEPDCQVRVVLRNCGIIDPESMDDAISHGGYEALGKVLREGSPDDLIKTVEESGLRGRGGAGFPTGLKWKLTRQPQAERKFVICNADEGDPGAFMDRSILEGDPHGVLEGLALAGYAVGATKGFFYIRAEYPLAVKRVQMAIEEARQKGWLGIDIQGSGWDFDIEIRLGAGAFVCGEETALIASVEGKRGSPSPRPPYPSVEGLWGMPTSINNVETLAAVPWIVANGAEAYAAHGLDRSRGTKVFAVTGKVKNAQLVEVPMGTTVRQIVYDVCGGVQDDNPIKGVQTGGPSGGIIPEDHLDTPITYETLQELGSIMGSGGMLVMDDSDCMVDVSAFYLKFCVDESCGKCAPCRVGGYQMLQLLLKVSKGRASTEDLDQIHRICQAMRKGSLCGLGQTAPNPVLSTLRFFEDEYVAYIEGGTSYARKRKRALAEGKPLQLSA